MIEALGFEESVYTGGGLEPGTPVFSFVLDWMATFGLTLIPLGGILLVAARDPARNRLLVHLVIWHEIVVGVVGDLWFISRDYASAGFFLSFIVVHLVVIGTGIRALRLTRDVAPREAPVASAPWPHLSHERSIPPRTASRSTGAN